MKRSFLFVSVFLFTIIIAPSLFAQDNSSTTNDEIKPEEKLVVLWTSADRDVALNMAFMYAGNSYRFNWWKDVTLLIWGPSAKLLTEDIELQEVVKKMKEAGVHLKACKACADNYGASDKLEALGVTVKYMGGELTEFLKEGRHVLTL